MSESQNTSWVPSPCEETCCPVCEATDHIEVGTMGRHDIPVRNVSCSDCGMVYVTPRPSQDQMAEFYRSHYRAQHVLPLPYNGGLAQPGTPAFEQAIQQRGENQADLALYLGKTQAGERVLDVGCRRGITL